MDRVETFTGLAASMFRADAKLKFDATPIKAPCLRSVKEDQAADAVSMFAKLLQLMGDHGPKVEDAFDLIREVHMASVSCARS